MVIKHPVRQPVGSAYSRNINVVDITIVLGLALFSILSFLSRWRGLYPYAFLGGDSGNIASFAAAWDNPTLFQGDEILGDPRNFRFYATIHIPLIRMLTKVTGDYGMSFIILLGVHVFVQGVGFHILGRVLFHNRYWATLLSIVTLIPIPLLVLGEYWGISLEPQPRFTFQALLPYLLAATVYWGRNPKFWPWIMVAAGLLIYAHPVSAPGWGVAIWMSLWVLPPSSISLRQKSIAMLWAALAFLAVTVPWVIFYLSNHAHGEVENYNQIYGILAQRFATGYFDIPLASIRFFSTLWHAFLLPVIVLVTGGIVFWWIHKPSGRNAIEGIVQDNKSLISGRNVSDSRRIALMMILWLTGILLTAIAIPLAEQVIAHFYQRLPVQVDLVRGVRYVIPILLLLCLSALVHLGNISVDLQAKRVVALTGALFVGIWGVQHRPTQHLDVLKCWAKGKFVCAAPHDAEIMAGLEAVQRLTPPKSLILPVGRVSAPLSLSIRYYSLRPVVYSYKDGGILGYTNFTDLLEWDKKSKQINAVNTEPVATIKTLKIIALTKKFGAQYCLSDSSIDPASITSSGEAEIIFRNSKLTLIKVLPLHTRHTPLKDTRRRVRP